MPIYAYRCSSCGFQNDYLQKVSDPVLTQCPQCGKDSFTKMLTAAGFQLKGSGWYATDFKNSGAKSTSTANDASKSDSSGDAGKSDSTAAAAHSCGAGACSTCS